MICFYPMQPKWPFLVFTRYRAKSLEGRCIDVNDRMLLEMLEANLRQHFQQVMIQYHPRLTAFARRLTGGSHDVEDLVQEAFVNAYIALENYSPERIRTLKLQPWLYRVLLNVYTHYARHTDSTHLHVVPLNLEDGSSVFDIEVSVEDTPECAYEQRERHQELAALVAQLPERYRMAVACYYFEHRTYQEIAEVLEAPVGTVKSTISRGIGLLRERLAKSQAQQHS